MPKRLSRNRKSGPGTYTWSDGTSESGDYLSGQKVGSHLWRRGVERWQMVYEQGDLVSTRREADEEPQEDRPEVTTRLHLVYHPSPCSAHHQINVTQDLYHASPCIVDKT